MYFLEFIDFWRMSRFSHNRHELLTIAVLCDDELCVNRGIYLHNTRCGQTKGSECVG